MSEKKIQIDEVGTVGERINMLVDHFCRGNKTAFGRAADIQSGVLAGIVGGRGSKPGFEILQKLLTAYPTVNPHWLLFGQGPMLQDSEAPTATATVTIDGQPHSLTDEQWKAIQKAILEITPAKAAAQADAEWLGRTYHFGDERTPGLPYDDRFSMRMGITGDDLEEFINTPEQFGTLRHTKIGNRTIVTERAIREWVGDIPKAV